MLQLLYAAAKSSAKVLCVLYLLINTLITFNHSLNQSIIQSNCRFVHDVIVFTSYILVSFNHWGKTASAFTTPICEYPETSTSTTTNPSEPVSLRNEGCHALTEHKRSKIPDYKTPHHPDSQLSSCCPTVVGISGGRTNTRKLKNEIRSLNHSFIQSNNLLNICSQMCRWHTHPKRK